MKLEAGALRLEVITSNQASQRMHNCIMRTARIVGVALVVCTLIGSIEASQVYFMSARAGQHLSLSKAAAITMPSWFVLAALVPFVIAVARRFPLENLHRPTALLTHAGAAVAYSVMNLLLAGWLSDFVFSDLGLRYGFLPNFWRLLAQYFTMVLVQYFGVVGIYYAFVYSRRYRDQARAAAELQVRASQLEASLSRANLEALRMQLNPHFLFNTLNTVSVLALKGEKQRVSRMVSRLSDLLRLSLENDRQTLSLREELEFLDRYLEIEQVRFKDRLTVNVDVEPAAYDAEVPSLLLQPIVENAVKYGFSQTIGPGEISIQCRVRDDRVEIDVSDTGPGLPDSRVQSGSTGVGLANTRARLEQLYGGDFTLELANRPEGGARVRVRFPFMPALVTTAQMSQLAGNA
jgi:two-component system, LytTR family, sensor kinase